MPSTLKYGITYPAGNVAPNVPLAMQSQAESVETAINNLKTDLMAKGLVAVTTNNATSGGLSGTGVLTDYVQVALVAGRQYRVSYRVNTISSTAANLGLVVALKKSATSDVTNTGTDIDNFYTVWTAPVANSSASHIVDMVWTASATETVNIKAVMARSSGSALFDISARKLAVYDMGKQF